MNTTKAEKAPTGIALKARWDNIKKEEPKLRTLQIAEKLGVSEAELIASACDGETVIRLKEDWEGLLRSIGQLGDVMALTRNHAAVHEKTGTYQNIKFNGHAGLVLDKEIDLRIFHKMWAYGFAVPIENPRGTLHGFHFFDKSGGAVHKIYVKNSKKLEAYHSIVNEWKHPDQTNIIDIQPTNDSRETVADDEVNADDFIRDWSNLKDTHDFFPLLRKYKLERTQALGLAEGKFATKVSNASTARMLELAAEREVPIMVFVRSSGTIQIHSGPVSKIKPLNGWLNILDERFNLHLRQDLFDSSWIVEKPTEDGVVTSLEIFDRDQNDIVTFFGARKPGKPELSEWRDITSELKTTGAEVQ